MPTPPTPTEVLLIAAGGFAVLMLSLWALTNYLDAQKTEAQQLRVDAPALRSVALVELQPSGAWQQLEDESVAMAQQRFETVLERVREAGLSPGRIVTEDWGLSTSLGPWLISFSSRDDQNGWSLQVTRSGSATPQDSEATRQLLEVLHEGLEQVAPVRWVKAEGPSGASAARPFEKS